MWIARDKDGELTLFSNKPHRCTDAGWNNESWDVVSMDEFTLVDYPTVDDRLSNEVLKSSDRLKQEVNNEQV